MPRSQRARRNRSGFTLLETIVVVALVSVFLVAALPSYSNYISDQHALTAARTLSVDLRTAKQEAVTRRAPITVRSAVGDPLCGAASYTIAQDAALIKRNCLPPDVEWASVPRDPLVFESVGAPRVAATFAIRSVRTGRRYTIAIAAETGAVTDDVR